MFCLNPCSNGRYSQSAKAVKNLKVKGLNPCSNGRYSQSYVGQDDGTFVEGLNPCSNGRYSQSIFVSLFSIVAQVLILVLMEDTLRV